MARPDRMTDAELAAAANRGDRRALETLLHRHADRVNNLCRRIVVHPEDARDAAQEALIAVTRGLHNFDGRSQFTTWLYRVATNAALDELRRRKRRPVPSEVLPERSASGPDLAAGVADRIVIDAAMAQLAPEFRAAVALRDLEGYDYSEIAAILDIPAGTVRSRIARGRAALASQLSDDLGNRTDPADHQSN